MLPQEFDPDGVLSEEEVAALYNGACYNQTTQRAASGGDEPTWTCDDRCVTPDDFVDDIMLREEGAMLIRRPQVSWSPAQS